MKILLLGEYSSLHYNLYLGLRHFGHEVHLASTGDGNRDIFRTHDISFKKNKNRIVQGIYRIRAEKNLIDSLGHYDVIQIMNPNILSKFHLINPYKHLRKKCDKMIMLSAGLDKNYLKYARIKFDYSYEFKQSLIQKTLNSNENYLFEKVDGIITTAYTYKRVHEEEPKFIANIEFPIIIEGSPRIILKKDKFVFYHGNKKERYFEKGTNFIENAINNLDKKYKLENAFHVRGVIPYKKYLQLMSRVDCIIDQVYSYDPGMNALIAMMKGKIVFGGCENSYMDFMGIKTPPLINIRPDSDYIKNQIIDFLEHPSRAREISKNAYLFVKSNHNHLKVAKQYLDVWKNL